MTDIVLYDYWRSSASYRVRIALALKGLSYDIISVNLLDKAHKSPEHLQRNAQGLVPALEIDGQVLTQSLAIMQYLEDTRPDMSLIPTDPIGKARTLSLAYAIAMEIHPICNLSVSAYVTKLVNGDKTDTKSWMQHFISKGLGAFETMLDHAAAGSFCFGDTPTIADCCLVPQVYNARRWGVDLAAMPRIRDIDARCNEMAAFKAAHPDQVNPE